MFFSVIGFCWAISHCLFCLFFRRFSCCSLGSFFRAFFQNFIDTILRIVCQQPGLPYEIRVPFLHREIIYRNILLMQAFRNLQNLRDPEFLIPTESRRPP